MSEQNTGKWETCQGKWETSQRGCHLVRMMKTDCHLGRNEMGGGGRECKAKEIEERENTAY